MRSVRKELAELKDKGIVAQLWYLYVVATAMAMDFYRLSGSEARVTILEMAHAIAVQTKEEMSGPDPQGFVDYLKRIIQKAIPLVDVQLETLNSSRTKFNLKHSDDAHDCGSCPTEKKSECSFHQLASGMNEWRVVVTEEFPELDPMFLPATVNVLN